MQPCGREMQSINSLLNQQFDPAHDEFLDQILSSVPSSWPPDLSSGNGAAATSAKTHMAPWDNLSQTHLGSLEDQSTNSLTSKLRQQQIGTTKALMFQQQLMLGGSASGNCLRSPTGNGGFMSMPLRSNGDHSDICLDGSPFDSANSANDASVQALYDQFTGSLGQPSNHLHHFQQPQGGGIQAQDMGTIAAAATMNNQSVGSGSAGRGGGGGSSAQPKQQRVRARRGQATDPHSIAERLRRERIAERMKALQELVPNANKTDKASMLDEIVDYVKFLQLQVKVLSMSRLGGAAAVNPRVADMPPQAGGVGEAVQGNGRSSNGTQTAAASSTNDTMTVTEHQVAKLMEEDMGSAMQYLQGKGLCLMPISLATAISTATCQPRSPNLLRHNNTTNNNHHHPRLGSGGNGVGDGSGGPSSPNMSGLTVQSATLGNDPSVKDAASVSKP